MLIVFDDMIADMENKKDKSYSPILTELFSTGRKPNISIVFKPQSYFKVPETKTKGNTLFYYENT